MPIGTANGDYFEDGMDLRVQSAMSPNTNPLPNRGQLYNPPTGNFDPNITDPLLDRPDPDPRMWRRPPNPDNPYDKQQRLYVTPIRDNPPEGPEKQFTIPLRIRYPLDTKDQNIINPGGQNEPGGDNFTRDKNEYNPEDIENNYFVKDYYPEIYPIAGPAETEPLVRHKVDQPTPNLLQKALGIGTQGDRYQMWPERAARGMAAGAQQESQGIFHALTGMLNPDFEEDKNILKGFYNTVKNAFSLPGDVYGGKIDPMSKEGIERAADLAGLMVYGPAPVANKMADGSLGSFAGVKSKTHDAVMLDKAQALEQMNTHKDEIWNQYGWFRAPDNHWKYEISDLGSHLNPEKLEMKKPGENLQSAQFKIPEEKTINPKDFENAEEMMDAMMKESKRSTLFLDDILHHPELFKAYPHLKDVQVLPMHAEGETKGWLGYHNPASDEIGLKSGTLKDMHSVLMHEIQHSIQQHEGFDSGSNPAYYTSENWKSLLNEFQSFRNTVGEKVAKKYPGSLAPIKYLDFFNAVKNEHLWTQPRDLALDKSVYEANKKNLADVKKQGLYADIKKIVKGIDIIERHEQLAGEMYWRNMGEVESRNVQKRLEPEQMINPPWYTQSIPTFAQVRSPANTISAAVNRPRIPKNMQEELDQLMENRRTNRLMGYDVDSPDYEYYNNRINELKSKLGQK